MTYNPSVHCFYFSAHTDYFLIGHSRGKLDTDQPYINVMLWTQL